MGKSDSTQPRSLERRGLDALVLSPGSLRVLLVGDVLGRPGRGIFKQVLPLLREVFALDFVVINGENIAGGFGITEKAFAEVLAAGVDVVTLGNHWNDKPDVFSIKGKDKRLVFPHNLTDVSGVETIPDFAIPGRGVDVSVINLLGNFAMKAGYGDPFRILQKERASLEAKMRSGRHVVLVDFHAEASSEKQAAFRYFDGIATAVVGTHTHVPTGDERVSARGTAFLTDIGMTGPYESIIGMSVEKTLRRYLNPGERGPHEVAKHDVWFCGLLVEASVSTGLSVAAHRLQYRVDEGEWRFSSARAQTGSHK